MCAQYVLYACACACVFGIPFINKNDDDRAADSGGGGDEERREDRKTPRFIHI